MTFQVENGNLHLALLLERKTVNQFFLSHSPTENVGRKVAGRTHSFGKMFQDRRCVVCGKAIKVSAAAGGYQIGLCASTGNMRFDPGSRIDVAGHTHAIEMPEHSLSG